MYGIDGLRKCMVWVVISILILKVFYVAIFCIVGFIVLRKKTFGFDLNLSKINVWICLDS